VIVSTGNFFENQRETTIKISLQSDFETESYNMSTGWDDENLVFKFGS